MDRLNREAEARGEAEAAAEAAAAAAKDQRIAHERAHREQAAAEETARIRAELAAQYPELAALSPSTTQPAEAPF
ncbi:hypothetical protein OHT52_31320 [Streptomyces sp. NBC_00247]|uniref:hypothetical protein n=1 Tax=Streptomyces sp. NBC_00247 TaxID=2975689 RepID=UPI002E2B6192|nr:hypothetical protein [Streptomyces sp. NBC_00247]